LSRYLIVNADDFGLSPGINEGVAACHEQGIVTSASLMVRWPAATQAASFARSHRRLSVGLHVDLSEWTVVDGEWRPLYERVEESDAGAVEREIRAQLESFRELIGREPTHIDGHQHVQREEPARSVILELASALGTPVRDLTHDARYIGGFYGQGPGGEPLPEAIGVEGLTAVLDDLPPGITELGCHPAVAEDFDSLYRRDRLEEVKTLCDPRVREALDAAGIRLLSFADLRQHR
jgi:chitin disaccharide deacetylase